MPREYRHHLEDILEFISRIRIFIQGYSQQDFVNDLKTQDAVLRNLQVIGEAARFVPREIRELHPEVEWRKIIGLRDIITHQFFYC